jgi:hypothetical protein
MPSTLVKWREKIAQDAEFVRQWKQVRSKYPLVALMYRLDRLALEEALVESSLLVRPGLLSEEQVAGFTADYRNRKRNRDRCLGAARTADEVGACLSAYPFP